MWTTLAFALALSLTAADEDKLSLTNVRTTYGVLGPTQPQ